jgi:hypothetical protein
VPVRRELVAQALGQRVGSVPVTTWSDSPGSGYIMRVVVVVSTVRPSAASACASANISVLLPPPPTRWT